MRPARAFASLAVGAALVASCGGGDRSRGVEDDREIAGTVIVLAATSLQGAFDDVAQAFEDARPGIDVQLTADGSANLATAIIEGAPADVFASADAANLARVVDAGRAEGEGTVFATNHLQIVVEEGNPLGIRGLADLLDPEISLSLCTAEVPCGRYARQAFEAAGLEVPPAGEEDKVSGVLTKVLLGEVDAGIVYVTDVLAAEGVEGVDLADHEQVLASYPASTLSDAPNPRGAAAFVAFLTGPDARAILEDHGFGLP